MARGFRKDDRAYMTSLEYSVAVAHHAKLSKG